MPQTRRRKARCRHNEAAMKTVQSLGKRRNETRQDEIRYLCKERIYKELLNIKKNEDVEKVKEKKNSADYFRETRK